MHNNQCPTCGSYKNHSIVIKNYREFLHCPYCESEWENSMAYVHPTYNYGVVSNKALAMAERALAFLENQAAGYGSLSLPVHLQISLEDKRREVAEMKRNR